MGDKDERENSGSSTAIFVVIGLLALGLSCLLAVALAFGTSLFFYRSVPSVGPPPVVQPGEPQVEVKAQSAPPMQVVPVEEAPAEQPAPVGDQK